MRQSVRRGFTLLEIMIVLVLISILGGLSIPKLGVSRYRADGAMRSMQAALQQAERAAVQRQSDVMVSFDTVKHRIRILHDVNNNHIVDAGEEVRWKPLEEGNRFAIPPKGVNGTVAKAVVGSNLSVSSDGYPTVYYRRDGAVSSAYELYLRSSGKDLNDFRGLIITQATGRVETYRYNFNAWRKAGL